LLLRHIIDYSTSTKNAIDMIVGLSRGVTWLYAICDPTGDCVVLETIKSMSKEVDPLIHVTPTMKRNLPTYDFIKRYSNVTFRNGVYTREMNHKYPIEFLRFNKNLFEIFNVSYPGNKFK
jgi:hypothetical protein